MAENHLVFQDFALPPVAQRPAKSKKILWIDLFLKNKYRMSTQGEYLWH